MFRSFKKQLTVFSISFIILMSGIMIFLCYSFIYRNIISLAMQYNNQIIHQLCNNIDFFLKDISEEINSLSYTSEVRFYGSRFITPGVSPSRSDVKKVLWDAVSTQNELDDISLIYDNKKVLSLFNMYDEKSLLELCDYYKEHSSYFDTDLIPMIHFNNNGHPALSCIKYISNSSDAGGYYIVGSIVIDKIFGLLNDIDLGDNSGACLIDTDGTVQYSSLPDESFSRDMTELIQINDFSESSDFIISLSGEKYIVSIYPLDNSGLSTVVYLPLSNVTKTTLPLFYTMIGIILLFLMIGIVISIRLSKRMTIPITNLAEYARNWEGYNSPVEKVKGNEETDILYDAFQEMNKRIQLLVQKNIQDEEEKRQAEILALQAQINPHFLYNTLDSINALAILNDNPDISDMTTSLAQLLQLSIGRPDEFITVENELEYVKAYLTIQKIRYNDKFDVDFYVDNSIRSQQIIRLILQPLIENCIYHGFEQKNGPGHISLKIWGEQDVLFIQISDNGIGVDPETEKDIQRRLAAVSDPITGSSVGIYNVNKRLHLYYGGKASLTFHSVQDKGTIIMIQIPKGDL